MANRKKHSNHKGLSIRSIGVLAAAVVVAAGGISVIERNSSSHSVHADQLSEHLQSATRADRTQSNETQSNNAQSTTQATHTQSTTELAVFSNPGAQYSATGYPLYSVMMSVNGKATSHLMTPHGQWVKYSPDGSYIAVSVANPNPSNGKGPALYIMKSDGSAKQKVLGTNFAFGAWDPKTNAFVYASMESNVLHQVVPGNKPVAYSLKLAKGSRIDGIAFSPDGHRLVSWITLGDFPNQTAHDELIVTAIAKGSSHILVQTKGPNGLILGPWAKNGQSIFWWPDPQHSGSIAADGLTLHQTFLTGKTKSIATTLVDGKFPQSILHTVVPYADTNAALQVGVGRGMFTNKQIGLWRGGHLTMLPSQPGQVQVSPAITSDGKLVAFANAPDLKTSPNSSAQFNAWISKFTLALYNVKTRHLKTFLVAGGGVQTPVFSSDGKDIIFIQGGRIKEIAAAGVGKPRTLVSIPHASLQLGDSR